jgi:dTMP kinase
MGFLIRSNLRIEMNHLGGKFIVFDGGEGCGKSTQAGLLISALEKSGVPTLAVRDPGSTRIGEIIRGILLDPANGELSMRSEMLLYMAARAQMVRDLISPAISAGKCVICDRFVSSTLAYQVGGEGMTGAEIRKVAEVAVAGVWPDLTIILDMPVDRSSARLVRKLDRIEQRPVEYHQRVRENYLLQAKEDPKRVRVIAADRDREVVHREVMDILGSLK